MNINKNWKTTEQIDLNDKKSKFTDSNLVFV